MNQSRPRVRRKPGRPTKLTPEVQEKIVQLVRAGNYVETAAACASVAKQTVHDWLRRGGRERERLKKPGARKRPTEERYALFSDAVEKAQGEAEARDLMLIARHAESQWQAAAWRLERKFPDRYGRRERRDVQHSGEVGVTHTLADLIKQTAQDDTEDDE